MGATKYDAMIAALETLQNITDKPDWMLKEEELKLRDKMHNDELDMSFMMTQIKTGTTEIDDLQDQIHQYDAELVDIRARILGTGKESLDEIKLPENKTESGQTMPDDMYKGYEKKYKDRLIEIDRIKRDKQDRLNKLKYRYKKRGEEFGTATGELAVQTQIDKAAAHSREERRLEISEDTYAEMTRIRTATELQTEAKYRGTDPATVTADINTIYAGLQTQVSDEGIFGPDEMMEFAEGLGGIYADNAETIANKLAILFTTSMTGESFLTAVKNEDDIYMDFLMETGMPTQPGITEMNLLSLSGSIKDNQTGAIDPMVQIQSLIEGLPPLVRRNK